MQVVITPHALMAPIHYGNFEIDEFILHYRFLKFLSENEDFFSSYVFSDSIEVLSNNNLFPAYQTFNDYLCQHEWEDEVSANDLVMLFNNIMLSCEDIRDLYDVHEFEIGSKFSFPQITTTPICNTFTNNSIAFCGYLEKVKKAKVLPLLDCNIISDKYSHEIPEITALDQGDFMEMNNLKLDIDLYKSCIDLMDSYCSSQLWQKSETSFSFKLSIYYKCKEILASKPDRGKENICLDSFEIGARFIDSLNSHQCSGSGRFGMTLLESIARLLLKDPKNEVKIFATSAGGSTPRKRGDDIAYRVHITKSGEGLRLMYWLKRCGTIELANVANKSEIVIY